MESVAVDPDIVRSLPSRTLDLPAGPGDEAQSFSGALLSDYVRAAGLLPESRARGGFGNYYFILTGAGGATATIAYGEIGPGFSAKPVLLAYGSQDAPMDDLRLIVPGDRGPGRTLGGLHRIEARAATASAETRRERGVELAGQLQRPRFVGLDELSALDWVTVYTWPPGSHSRGEPARALRGPRVYDLLAAAGLASGPPERDGLEGKVVVATSGDGFTSVFAGAEIDPGLQGADVIVAVAGDAGALGEDDGYMRLVAPQDRSMLRHVRGLARLELRGA